jgi:hypothetical protein
MVETKFPNLTPVEHKKEKYTGWIDGVTKIEALFTGNTDVAWQYRIFLLDGTRRFAPEEDLVHIRQNPDFPPKELLDRYVESFEGESELHALGYNLSDLNPEQRKKLLVFCAMPMLGPERVLKSLCDILWRKVRRNKTEKIDKYHNAIEQWSHDLDFVLEKVDVKKLNQEIRDYVKAVKEHIEQYTDIETSLPAKKIISPKAKKRTSKKAKKS